MHWSRALASPSLPPTVAKEAIERAEAGEHITVIEAKEKVAAAKAEMATQLADMREALENAVAEERAKQAEETAAAIADATARLANDKKALRARLTEIRRRQQPDVRFIENAVKRNLGIKRLSSEQWNGSRKWGTRLRSAKKVYEPITKETLLQNEENLRIASKITRSRRASGRCARSARC
jgi:hypothetical protein